MTEAAALRRPAPAAIGPYAAIDDFAPIGVQAIVTTRAAGDFGLAGQAPVGAVLARWRDLRVAIGAYGPGSRFATALQVHGTRVLRHGTGWEGWVRADDADGHFASAPGTGLGVTIADCVPVFIAHPHPTRAVALVHAGWRGTASGILQAAIEAFRSTGLAPADLRVHLGPAICGACYEVGPDVYAQLTGRHVERPHVVDLRQILADQARSAGVRAISISPWCTRCHNDLFFSHRAGDPERQVAAIIAQSPTLP
jgi:YfiH family protein